MRLNRSLIIIVLLIWNTVDATNWWNGWSPNNNNDRYQRAKLPVPLPTNKTEFEQLWYTKLDGPIEATPTVYENRVYVPTRTGTLYCLQTDNGSIVGQKNISSLVDNNITYASRTSPLVYNDMLILGLSHSIILLPTLGDGAYIVAIKLLTGKVVWRRRVSSHPAALITATPQLAGDRLFTGTSSSEEYFALDPKYPCCTFQGSVVALNATTGALLWERKMVPDNRGKANRYSGAAVWGSQFPVDYKRNQIYVATGNYYKLPASVQKCLTDTSNLTLLSDPCAEPNAYGQSVVALDMRTGLIRWSQLLGPINAWTVACVRPDASENANCPSAPGEDYDFGQAPILKSNIRYKFGGARRDQLFVGQKSGIVLNLDAETGKVIWSKQVSPGSQSGGMEFGSAADDKHLYVGNNNGFGIPYTLPNGATTTKASWSAINLVTGKIRWTTLDPTTDVNPTSAFQALSVWDKLVLVQGGIPPSPPQFTGKGCFYGLNKRNGQVLCEKCVPDTPIGSGASVAQDTIYVGIGYLPRREATDGLMALKLPRTS